MSSPVLILNQHLPPDPAPTGRLAGELLAALAQAGLDARGIAGPTSYGAPDDPDLELPVEHVPGTAFGRRTLLGKGLDAVSFLGGALYHELVQADRPSGGVVVVMSSPPPLPILGARLARARRAKLVIWCQDLWPDVGAALGVWKGGGWLDRLARRAIHAAYRRADRVVVLSKAMRERVLAFGVEPERVEMVPNWAPAGLFDAERGPKAEALRSSLGAAPDELLVLYSGNLGRVHEFETIAKAACEVASDHTIRFVFAGTGPRRAEAERLLAGVAAARFLDRVPNAGFADRLVAADVHLVTLRDGLAGLSVPSKAASAWAAARPTLFIGPAESQVARATGLAELGMEVRNGDVTGAVAALRELARDPLDRAGFGTNARRWAREHHSPGKNIGAFVDLIRDLL